MGSFIATLYQVNVEESTRENSQETAGCFHRHSYPGIPLICYNHPQEVGFITTYIDQSTIIY